MVDGRRIELETKLVQLHTPEAKEREIRKYTKSESQQLRLRRTKIKLSDFRTVKVIGKGAFGEVSEFQFQHWRIGISVYLYHRFVWCKRLTQERYMP